MKKLFLIAALALTLGACGNKTQKAEEVAAEETAEANETLTGMSDGDVATLSDDYVMRPDTKVDQLTVLDFNATWCGPCKELTPVFHQAASAFTNVRFVSVDIDNCRETATAFGIEAVPTVVIMRPDGTSERFVGTQDLLPYDRLAAVIEKNLK